jgi:hypothetical protein
MNRLVDGRLVDLLAENATACLCPAEATELRRLLPDGCSECLEFERAAAAIDLALAPPVAEPLRRTLRDRILIGAGRYMESVDHRVAAGRRRSNEHSRDVGQDDRPSLPA